MSSDTSSSYSLNASNMTDQTRHPTAKRYREGAKNTASKIVFVCVTVVLVGGAAIFLCVAVFLVVKEWNKTEV